MTGDNHNLIHGPVRQALYPSAATGTEVKE